MFKVPVSSYSANQQQLNTNKKSLQELIDKVINFSAIVIMHAK